MQIDPVSALSLTLKEDLSVMRRAGLGTVIGLAMRMS
jgi:type IV pilus assembly protein PilM